jgi:hypothetical protein
VNHAKVLVGGTLRRESALTACLTAATNPLACAAPSALTALSRGGNHRFTQEEKAGAEADATDARCHDAVVREHGRIAEPGNAAQPGGPSALGQ